MSKEIEYLVQKMLQSTPKDASETLMELAALFAIRELTHKHFPNSEGLFLDIKRVISLVTSDQNYDLRSFAIEKLSNILKTIEDSDSSFKLNRYYEEIYSVANGANKMEFAEKLVNSYFEQRFIGSSKLADSVVINTLEAEATDMIACVFDHSLNVAFELAKTNNVTFFAKTIGFSTFLELLAIGADLKLNVVISDPLNVEEANNGNTVSIFKNSKGFKGKFDHVVCYPPFGMRETTVLPNGERLQVSSEVLQFETFKNTWAKSYITLVPDGALFRTSNYEVQIRREILNHGLSEIISLPNGIISNSGLSTSIVKLTDEATDEIKLIDGRTINSATSRATSSELNRHITALLKDAENIKNRTALVSKNAIEANQFNMTVDRYVISNEMKKIDELLLTSEVVLLGDMADILRPQAAKPCREDEENAETFKVREIVTGDVENSEVLLPARTMTYFQMDFEKVKNSMVRDGDIIVSTKGKVGVIGLINGENINDDEPWIISQSFAIVRLKKLSPIKDPRILVSLLTASWSIEKLNSFAAGTTVQMIPLVDLKNFSLPLASIDSQSKASAELDEISKISREILQLREQINAQRARLQSELWGFKG